MTSQTALSRETPKGEPEAEGDAPQKAVKIPLKRAGKRNGVDIASQMRVLLQAEAELGRNGASAATPAAQTLELIAAMEETLREKRSQIEGIRVRQEAAVGAFAELNQSLDAAKHDLARTFAGLAEELESDTSAGLAKDKGARQAATKNGTKNGTKTGSASKRKSKAKASECRRDPELDKELAALPPVPRFLGAPLAHAEAEEKAEGAARGSGLNPRTWWKQAMRG